MAVKKHSHPKWSNYWGSRQALRTEHMRFPTICDTAAFLCEGPTILLCSKSSTIYLPAQLSVPSLLFVVIKKLTPQVIYSDAGNQGGLLLGRSHYSAT